MNNKLLLILSLFLLLTNYLWPNTKISKDILKEKVKKQVEEILLEHSADKKSEDDKKRIYQIAERVAKLIIQVPDKEINKETADWISNSISALINNRVEVLIKGGEYADNLIKSLERNRVLKKLNTSNAKQLLKRRDMLLSTGKTYRVAFRKFLIEKLSKADKIQVEFDIRTQHESNLLKKESSLLDEMNDDNESAISKRINSAILTLMLIRELDSILNQYKKRSSMSEYNLFFLFFDNETEEGKVQPLGFNEVKPNIEKLLKETVVWDDSTAIINISDFKKMINRVSNMRFINKIQDKDKMKLPLIKQIKFANYKESWKLLHKKEIAEAEKVEQSKKGD